MQNRDLLLDILAAESEADLIKVLSIDGVLEDSNRWRPLGAFPNNQSIVHAQQSSPAAALVEKFTNSLDAILLKHCKTKKIDPRSAEAPQSMKIAVADYFGDLSQKSRDEIRSIAEDNLVLYATGGRSRPCLSIYDAGEGQLAQNFPETFCSLIFSNQEGSYKGAVPFVQGRFNMGGTGVLPFCGDGRKMQLIVSRPPPEIAGPNAEWAFTVFCFFPSKSSPEWRYMVGTDGNVMTAGVADLGLVPKKGAKAGEICAPRERMVSSGTLIKMFDYKAPRSNICGELYKKLDEYLLRPMLPLRLIECRKDYKANVMAVTMWNRFAQWASKLEPGFEDGASIQIKLSTGEVIPAEIRVFKATPADNDDHPQTGLRALINGQSHAKRDAQFFRSNKVAKEHIAGSMLVTLDCTNLSQSSRNNLFMSNRESFREDLLLNDLFKALQGELRGHEGLIELNNKRYEEKIANAVTDDIGISALEDLLAEDPALASLFGSAHPGKVAAKAANGPSGSTVKDKPLPFIGAEFPTYFKRADGTTTVKIDLPRSDATRVAFHTDVTNNYFTRPKNAGECVFVGPLQPSLHLFNGKLTLTFRPDKSIAEGTTFTTTATIVDPAGHGPFKLTIEATIVAPREKTEKQPPKDQKVDMGPSRPAIIEVEGDPDDLPIRVERDPKTTRLTITINTGSRVLAEAKQLRAPEEEPAVRFVFKFGLALVAMGMIEAAKSTPEWETEEVTCRARIDKSASAAGRVIVPLCLTLPKKLPKVA
ncbi:hypothetical protein LB534_00100 [Mesorhizobium sp. CA18]|uniref:hypothetical protein n=1 Tax=unclassified Mesorhizobium TaxID=325217 RepID=UPI001CCC53E0|nr:MULTISPECIES: hypothetical protein [unclassified Mesorhizobium]MBZ9732236.1 hypothetical protein [Mesorhizobium sp. CA9]MBZ9823674.1 hypothetical protein [Mesorhizobium sp. CA18]MBZ9829902.1 hypothetical protein [Mesorhizobium sp. CA2]MBZ9836000.1 hypothetical protein [Mesorhizobium sp. CA3]MBZ9875316.1 hypothetical protein [Mesorhizobium sp. Ca11]